MGAQGALPDIETPVVYPDGIEGRGRGNRLGCRLPLKTVAVRPPGALLREVLRLCDDRLAWKGRGGLTRAGLASGSGVIGFGPQLPPNTPITDANYPVIGQQLPQLPTFVVTPDELGYVNHAWSTTFAFNASITQS